MGSQDPVPAADKANVTEASVRGACSGKKIQGKIPKRIHKAEREKQKREHFNELFLELADALELNQQNNGKASILCEATRLLKDLIGQIEYLQKENASLLSESNYDIRPYLVHHRDGYWIMGSQDPVPVADKADVTEASVRGACPRKKIHRKIP